MQSDTIETEARALWAELLRTIRRPRPRVASALQGAVRLDVESPAGTVAAWRRGTGPAVLLAHGWADDHNLWGPMIECLAERGHAVVAFDFPGHGISGGDQLSLDLGASAVQDVANACGPVTVSVGHSFGCTATSLAISKGLAVERAIFIASPTNRLTRLARIAAQRKATPAVIDRVKALHAERFGPRDIELELTELAPRMTIPALFVHSRDDEAVPYHASSRAHEAWPESELWLTDELNHRRTVRDPAVIERVLEYIRR